MKFKSLSGSTSLIAMIGAMAFMPAAVQAQDTGAETDRGSEIIVTAQRRDERSVDVPISITAIGPEALANANVEQLGDIAKLTPALRFDSSGTFVQPTIRGVGTAITTSGGGPNVGIYVDGFFQSNPQTADFQLLKVSSIQVLKGPQGTLFGRNTTGGAIIVTTNDPSTDPAAEFRASYGRFNALKLQGYGTFGLGERVAMDLEGIYSRGNGHVTNIVDNDRKVGAYENWSMRAGLKAELSDSISVLLRYTHSETDDPTALMTAALVDTDGQANFFAPVSAAGKAIYQTNFGISNSKGAPLVNLALLPTLYPAFSRAPLIAGGQLPVGYTGPAYSTAPGTVAAIQRISFVNKSDSIQGTIKADLGFADLTSYTQYRKDDSVNLQDLDNSAADFFYGHLGIDNETFGQEFLLNSKPGGKLQWTVGVNYFQNRDTYIFGFAAKGASPFIPFGGSSTTTKSYAAFADMTYEVSPQFFITAGARYSHDIVTDAFFRTTFADTFYFGETGNIIPLPAGTAPQTAIPVPDLKSNRVVPRVVLRYKPSDQTSIYASYTRGYKAGILNVGGSSLQPIRPEVIDAFEVGYKYDDRALSLDIAAYYYDYKDLQVSSFQTGKAKIRNAASSRIYGLEGNVRYRVSDAFTLNAGAAYTNARYKNFTNAPYYAYCDPVAPATSDTWCVPVALGGSGPGGLTQTTVDGSGFRMQRAPEFTGTIGATYKAPLAGGELVLSGNLYYTSKFYHDPTQQFVQNGYEILSLRAAWTDSSDRFTLGVFGDNITGKRHITVVSYNTIGTGAAWNPPATWGVEIGAKF